MEENITQPTAESKVEEVQLEQEMGPEVQSGETLPQGGEPEPQSGTFAKKVIKIIFIVTTVIFLLSSLSGVLGKVLGYQNLGAGIMLWFVAAGASLIFPIIFLIWGAVTFKRGGSSLMGFSVLFFLVALLVGAGTCYLNMGQVHF